MEVLVLLLVGLICPLTMGTMMLMMMRGKRRETGRGEASGRPAPRDLADDEAA